jgi:aerobic-type carbon monoxide dehydrogenase small subunit (CoxS/CutS family)
VHVAKKLQIVVNGRNHAVEATPETPLLYVLKNELDLGGPMYGCGLSQCGACSVLADGKEIRSCVTPVAGVVGKKIISLEGLPQLWADQKGLSKVPEYHPVQKAWIDEQVPQCGYCQSGMMVTAAGLLAKKPRPTDAEIRKGMNGHLCRCGTQTRIISAVKRASKAMG